MKRLIRYVTGAIFLCFISCAPNLLLCQGASGAEPYFADDMEGPAMWTPDVPWAINTAEFHSTTTAWTDSPGTYYAPLSDISLTLTDPVDLSLAVQPQLVFWHKYQIETGFDVGTVEISADGGVIWLPLLVVSGVSGWKREQIDLTAYAGQASLLVRFRLVTDKTVAWDGWYIDDVTLSEPPNAVAVFTVSNPTATSLDLTWTQNLEAGFASYKIYRSTSPGVDTSSTLVAVITDQNSEAYIDTGLDPETTYYYRLYVFDTYDLATGSKETSETTDIAEFAYPFFDDLEGSTAGWAPEPPWALTTAHAHSATHSWTDSPGGAYAANEDTSLQITLDLGTANMPVLSFWHRYTFENASTDYGYIEVREVGATTWKRLFFATGTLAAWTEEQVDLSDYAGKEIEIRFRVVSDGDIQSDGWYIDDIRVGETQSSIISYPFSDDMEAPATAGNWHSSSWALVSDAHSGVMAWTDSPYGNYGLFTSSELVMANSIDLSAAVYPQLSFWHKYDTRNCPGNYYSSNNGCASYIQDYDYATVYLSTYNGQPGTWNELAAFKGDSSGWSREVIDLSPWAGLPNVRIKFVMTDTQEGSTNYVKPGWWIDDVVVEEAPAGVVLSITGSTMNQVDLSWTENNDADFDRYELYRASGPAVSRDDTLVAMITSAATTTFTDAVAMVQPGVYYYRLWVFDSVGNVSLASNEVQASYTIPENGFPFVEDGENGTGQWSWGSPWGLTNANPRSGSFSWTDSPGANYAADADTSLTTFIDLSSTNNPILTFWHRYSLEQGKDFVRLEVSTDGGQTWSVYRSYSGVETLWNQERVDLTPASGNARVGLRFRLTSDGSGQQDGWYLDDLTIDEGPIEGGYPFFDDAESGIVPWINNTPWGQVSLSVAQAHSGVATTVWTDSPEGAYAPNEDTYLSLYIDLGSASMPLLSFWQKYAFDANSDFGYVEVCPAGSGNWTRIYCVTGTSPWFKEQIDLTGYAGTQVEIRFRLMADANGIQSDGWYIDDIRIDETEAAPLSYPFFDNMDGAATATHWWSSSWALSTDAHSGTYSFTDSPAGDYGQLVGSELILSNGINLSAATHPQLTFWHRYDTRNCPGNYYSSNNGCASYVVDYDYASVWLSTQNGQPGTWTTLASYKGDSLGWTYEQLDLTPWAGLPDIRIKFVMTDTQEGSPNYTKPGWWIDDVALEEAPVDISLAITASTMDSVSLSWSQNNEADFDHYEIYRATTPGVTRGNTLIATIFVQSETAYVDIVSLVQPERYYYRMWVVDADGNVSLGSNEVEAIYAVPANPYPFAEDGETGTDQWSWGAPWGLTDVDPHGGTYCWTDSPGANYAADANTGLTTFVDLSGTRTPVLTFWHRYSLEEGGDFLMVEVSTDDGQTWSAIRSITGTETTWNQERINLTPYSGNAQFGIRFRLVADGDSNRGDGWYVDDLQIQEEAVSAAYPFFDDGESGIIPWFYDSPWGQMTLETEDAQGTGIVWSDSPGGSYRANEDSSLMITIDLGSASMPVLTFQQKYAFEAYSDYGYVEVREVGSGSWIRLYFVTGTSAAWLEETIDLSPYAGKLVDIRFRVISDGNGVQSDGWYLDDISIAETEVPVLPYPFADTFDGTDTARHWHSSSWECVSDSHSGAYSFTDSPLGNYGWLTKSELVLAGTVSLSGAVHPQLTFWHKYDTRNCPGNYYSSNNGCASYIQDYDYAKVYLSTYNGQAGTWTLLREFKGELGVWTEEVIDLDNWAGLPNVRIKFVMHDTQEGSTNYVKPGWWIDDVRVGEDESIPSQIHKLSGDGQEGVTGTALPAPFVARITDPNGYLKAGILVQFAVEGGDGSLSAASGVSTSSGEVSTTLTLGGTAGLNTVSATIDGSVETVTFSATGYSAGQPRRLIKVSGDSQVNTINLALANPLVVKVEDIFNAPVTGCNVTYTVVSGAGTLVTTDPVSTDSTGLASNQLVLGATTGSTLVSVSSPGLTPVIFTAHAVLPGGSLGDTDGDGMPDEWETAHGLDPLDPSDAGVDTDGDTLTNLAEYTYGTDPNSPDTDADGMPDDWEILYGLDPNDPSDADDDNDNDGVTNLQEYLNGTVPVFLRHFAVAGVTGESMDIYGNLTIDGLPAAPGDEIAAMDPDGVICGQFTVTEAGQYGFMHVYRDDPLTPVDEGADMGDLLTFRVWDSSVGVELDATPNVMSGPNPPAWTFDGDVAWVDFDGGGTQIIPLRQGWNLFSFSIKNCYYVDTVPLEPMLPGIVYQKVNHIGEVFASIDGLYDVVRGFDSQGAHTFDPDLPAFSDLTYIAAGYGYWIRMNAPGNLELKGIRILPSDTLDLHTGWNLAGYWRPDVQYIGTVPFVDFPPDVTTYTEVDSIDDILGAISGDYSIVRSYDMDGAHTFDPLIPPGFNDLDYLGPGYGMWLKMKTPAELSY